MRSEMIGTNIDHKTKIAFTTICDEIGLTPSEVIKLFAHTVIKQGKIPFDVELNKPNRDTIAAIHELTSGKGHKANSIDDLMNG
ncbi:type II toxin-antitoxin system RelB/DinJ family antitoxin [Vibrio sp. SS-MA-C1-2]|uniref:type II toxin-antitoxin system RelB/DinJ family antitoxin n=1 Tax=Vibrio sp. SS-MA-C1-2 TaxID=2908646 RepID=UPI001F36356D|nr:type II toxin-antitoxin system RelB/DinJ family antitoxin [Vibrio sp. SS-MA-C1-2]UJF18574.1 type II toxin-antitoxin system RelB/DinJ family antitoxin [Vibrio sp. SS-MA-C1-2]